MPSAVHILSELPTNGSGKVLKTVLRAKYAPRAALPADLSLQASPSIGESLQGIAAWIAAACGDLQVAAIGAEGGADDGAIGCVAIATDGASAIADVSACRKIVVFFHSIVYFLICTLIFIGHILHLPSSN